MKLLSYITALSTFFVIDAKEVKRKLTSKDVGSEHNRICLQVGERLKQKTPESKEDYIQHVREELLTLCDEGDTACHNIVHSDIEESLKEDYLGRDYETLIEDVIEDVDDEELKDALRDIYHSIFMLEEISPNEVIMSINEIADEYENRADVDEWKKHVVLSSASVAASSTELWTSAFFDPESGFYQTLQNTGVDDHTRMLQTTDVTPSGPGLPIAVLSVVAQFSVTVVSTIMSDLIGALVAGLAQFVLALLLLGDMATALTATIVGSINRSLMAFLAGTGLGQYKEGEDITLKDILGAEEDEEDEEDET